MMILGSKKVFLFITLLPTVIFGHNQYKYKYEIQLRDQQSISSTAIADTIIENGASILFFTTLDIMGDTLPFASIIVQGSHSDTLLTSNFDGYASLILLEDTIDISISYMGMTSLQLKSLNTKPNTKLSIIASLGKAQQFSQCTIYSKRELSKTEIKNITNDLGSGKTNELIESKICYVLHQI